MRLSRVRGVEWWCLQNLLGDVGDWRTAQYLILAALVSKETASNSVNALYPACVWIKEPPEDTILHDFLHGSATVEEDSQHTLPQLYYTGILLCFCRSCGIVCHRMLLRYRRYDKGRVQADQCRSQRSKFGVPAFYFKTLYLN